MIIDGNEIVLKRDNDGYTFEELEFLPYLNTELKIQGELTFNKVYTLLKKYPILKSIYSMEEFLEQYRYDELMNERDTLKKYKSLKVCNNYLVDNKNYNIKEVVQVRIDSMDFLHNVITKEYVDTPSINLEILTCLELLDHKGKEQPLYGVDLKEFLNIPLTIEDGSLTFVNSNGIFEEQRLTQIIKEKMSCPMQTEISFNEFFMTISSRPSFNSFKNRMDRNSIQKETERLKKILGDDFKDEA